MPDLRLKVDGVLYGGWQSIRVTRSIEQIAGSFDLSVTERWSGQNTPRPIRPGAACQVLIDGAPIITGYVDDVQIAYDSDSHTITVSGRDKTGDLVDCTADWFMFANMTLLGVAQRICKPFGIAVIDEVAAPGTFSFLRSNPGDSAFASLEAAAKVRAVLLVSDGQGGLVITRASQERIGALLLLGENIRSASATYSHKDRFSRYTISTQQNLLDRNEFGVQAIHLIANSDDPMIERYRPLTVIDDKLLNLKQAKEHADWERNVRYGKGKRIGYVVNGWHYDANLLWPINRLVAVKDEYLGVDDDLLIASTTFVMDDAGFATDLSLLPREAFDLVPLPETGDQFEVS